MSDFNIDYTSRDYLSLVDRADTFLKEILPEWNGRDDNDINWATIKTVAYLISIGMFYIDLGINEQDPYEVQIYKNALRLAKKYGMPVKKYIGAITALSVEIVDHPSTVTVLNRGIAYKYESLTYSSWEDISYPMGVNTKLVTVQFGEFEQIQIGLSDGTAYQIHTIPRVNVQHNMVRVLVNEAGRTYAEDPSGFVEWDIVESLIMSYKTAKECRLVMNSDELYELHFGDDMSGKQLPNGAIVVVEILKMPTEYETLNYGNLPAYNINTCSDGNVVAVTQLETATGGAGKESLSSIARGLPQWISTAARCVVPNDFRYIARRVAGVEDAIVNQADSNVDVYIIPVGGGFASSALKAKVYDYLYNRCIQNLNITINTPAAVTINVSIDINVLSDRSRELVRSHAYIALVSLLSNPLIIGPAITLQACYGALSSIDGLNTTLITALYKGTEAASLGNIQLANTEVSAVGSITVIADGGLI